MSSARTIHDEDLARPDGGALYEAVRYLLRRQAEREEQAEREATPPSGGVGDEAGDAQAHTPPPTPVPDEAVVEALARVMVRWHSGDGADTSEWDRQLAEAILAALDRGEVPGYGPTPGEQAPGVGAGEVVVTSVLADGRLAGIREAERWLQDLGGVLDGPEGEAMSKAAVCVHDLANQVAKEDAS